MKILPALLASILIAAVLSLAFNQKAQAIHYEITTRNPDRLSTGIGWIKTKILVNGRTVDMNTDFLASVVSTQAEEPFETLGIESELGLSPGQNLKHEVSNGVYKTVYELIGVGPANQKVVCPGGYPELVRPSFPQVTIYDLKQIDPVTDKLRPEASAVEASNPCYPGIEILPVLESNDENRYLIDKTATTEGLIMKATITSDKIIGSASGGYRAIDISQGFGLYVYNTMKIFVHVKITTYNLILGGVQVSEEIKSYKFTSVSPTFELRFPKINGVYVATVPSIAEPGNAKEPNAIDDIINSILKGGVGYNDEDKDKDGMANYRDTDIDGDGTFNENDIDIDGDGKTNANDADMDDDGLLNIEDSDINGNQVCNDKDPDTDADFTDNTSDSDDDNDGVPDISDPEPVGKACSAFNLSDPMLLGGIGLIAVGVVVGGVIIAKRKH